MLEPKQVQNISFLVVLVFQCSETAVFPNTIVGTTCSEKGILKSSCIKTCHQDNFCTITHNVTTCSCDGVSSEVIGSARYNTKTGKLEEFDDFWKEAEKQLVCGSCSQSCQKYGPSYNGTETHEFTNSSCEGSMTTHDPSTDSNTTDKPGHSTSFSPFTWKRQGSTKQGSIDDPGTSVTPSPNIQTDQADETCEASNWPDLDHGILCGPCKALVDKMSSKYITCNNYCYTIGRSCSGAWEEHHDSCEVKYNETCTHRFTGTTDAICQCGPKLSGIFNAVSSCSCSYDDDNACQSKYQGRKYCYVNSPDQCPDAEPSTDGVRWWSYYACEEETGNTSEPGPTGKPPPNSTTSDPGTSVETTTDPKPTSGPATDQPPSNQTIKMTNTSILGDTDWGTWKKWEYCADGAKINSFRLRVQSSKGHDQDDTSLNAIRLLCDHEPVPQTNHDDDFDKELKQTDFDDDKEVKQTDFEDDKEVKQTDFDDDKEVKQTDFDDDKEVKQTDFDDDKEVKQTDFDDDKEVQHISSDDGFEGDWGPLFECSGNDSYMVGAVLHSEPDLGDKKDNSAANNFDMHCSNGAIYEVVPGVGGSWGSSESHARCERNNWVCGMRVRMQDKRMDGGDNTALNQIQLACCSDWRK